MRPVRVVAEESAPAGVGRQATPNPGAEGVGHAIVAASGTVERGGGNGKRQQRGGCSGARTTEARAAIRLLAPRPNTVGEARERAR